MASANAIHERLQAARIELLDLSARNRLIHTPGSTARGRRVDIVGAQPDDVFRLLVRGRRALGFKAHPEPDLCEVQLQPSIPLAGLPEGPAAGHASPPSISAFQGARTGITDHAIEFEEHEVALAGSSMPDAPSEASLGELGLQTTFSDERLKKCLLSLYRDARTFEEEQGVNTLYLALGFLTWTEESSRALRSAPLVLVPVSLSRGARQTQFQVRYADEEITTNLSLQAKLSAEFGVHLPDVPDIEDLVPSDYFSQVQAAIRGRPDWQVQTGDVTLGFFSFARFLMYRDLDPEAARATSLDSHPLVTALLGPGFADQPGLCGDDDPVDPFVEPVTMVHVLDADGSQMLAIEEVKRGRNLVIQGPPGTGKSQTIANLIAAAVSQGMSVLFLAEKMAALDVVKRRLDSVGLGEPCLELFSHKASKRLVLNELARTLDLASPKSTRFRRLANQLGDARDRLNEYVRVLHEPLYEGSPTPYQVLGQLIRLRSRGVPPAEFGLPACLSWTSADVVERRTRVAEVAAHLRDLGSPCEHPWRGAMLPAVLPMDLDRLAARLPSTMDAVQLTCHAIADLASKMGVEPPASIADALRHCRLAEWVAAAPAMDRHALANPAWAARRSEISALVSQARRLSESQTRLEHVVVSLAWTTEVQEARRHLAAHGQSWLRWFNADYREAQATLRGILWRRPPRSLEARLEILDSLIAGQNALWAVGVNEQNTRLGIEAFGSFWRGAASDPSTLAALDAWESACRNAEPGADVPVNFREIAAHLSDPAGAAVSARAVADAIPALLDALRVVFDSLQLDLPTAFGVPTLAEIPLPILQIRLAAWRDNLALLSPWVAYQVRARKVAAIGLGELSSALYQGRLTCAQATDAFDMRYGEEMLRDAYRRYPILAEFEGRSHDELREQFARLDLRRIEVARREVAAAHQRGIPKAELSLGELGVIRREIEKKRRHLPLRQLLKQAGQTVQAIKPVFMMSPTSVAQYLEPGGLAFDLLLIDEASQIPPVDALGAVARAGQMVVVGDDKQLPPTRFFDKLLNETGDDDMSDVRNLESILGLCIAQNMPQRMLRWHYRSRHHSLIAFSNREFYHDKLHVPPSPLRGDCPLRFNRVETGVFDRGGSATNRVEAQAVARAVVEHARWQPSLSLGVGTFSVAQRDCILEELDCLLGEGDLEEFFSADRPEPFFVKNLENIQGDERDVIFISIGYARDASGAFAMQFGPLSNEGGERRLNVLITRARQRCEVFSSIGASDIDLKRVRTRGPHALCTFLRYAETGALGDTPTTAGSDGAAFDAELIRAVRGMGCEVETRLGSDGCAVEIAVIDPSLSDAYLLAIESDGPAYRAGRCARDRDRLRDQVLKDRGWTIHRVYISDWLRRGDEERKRLRVALDEVRGRQGPRA